MLRRKALFLLCAVGLLATVSMSLVGCGAVQHCMEKNDCGNVEACVEGLCLKIADLPKCAYNGKQYSYGASFPSKDGCNSCICGKDGKSACTLKACAPSCKYDGKEYKSGDSFPSTDGCNTCSCSATGQVACTEKACVPTCGGIAGTQCKSSTDYCEYPSGTCGAADQTGTCKPKPSACTEQYDPVCGCDDKTYGNDCAAAAAGVSVKSKGECSSTGTTCKYNGKEYKEGDAFPAGDGCNTCSCKGGQALCSKMPCTQGCGGMTGAKCSNSTDYCEYPSGTCGAADQTGTCKPKPQSCDTQYDPVCGCDDKTYGNACGAAAAGVSVKSKGECSSTGTTCKYNGKEYKAGDSFPASDGCNTCTCSKDGSVGCTEKACTAQCGGIAGLQCKNSTDYCEYPSGTCGAADQMGTCKPKPTACTDHIEYVCGCDGKTYGNPCEAAAAGVSIKSKDKCASTGNSCKYDGKEYKDGDSFPSTDGCNTCSCSNGNVRCTLRACVTCKYNGKEYKPGDSFPATDGCNTCTCSTTGTVGCTKKACTNQCGGIAGLQCKNSGDYCAYAAGTCNVSDRMGTCQAKPGACTQQYDPVCGCDGKTYGNACGAASAGMSVDYKGECKSGVTCKYDGKEYKEGDTFPAGDGCNTCTCGSNGVANCTKKACAERCGGFAGLQCTNSTDICVYADNSCNISDRMGTCQPKPQNCTSQYDPVCGCDKKTYSNRCTAIAAGATVDYTGACK